MELPDHATVRQIAEAGDTSLAMVQHVVRSRNIKESRRVGIARLFDRPAQQRILALLQEIRRPHRQLVHARERLVHAQEAPPSVALSADPAPSVDLVELSARLGPVVQGLQALSQDMVAAKQFAHGVNERLLGQDDAIERLAADIQTQQDNQRRTTEQLEWMRDILGRTSHALGQLTVWIDTRLVALEEYSADTQQTAAVHEARDRMADLVASMQRDLVELEANAIVREARR